MRLFLIIFLAFSPLCQADITNVWVETGLGGTGDHGAAMVNIKVGDSKSNWALEYAVYEDQSSFSTYVSRADNSEVEHKSKGLGITKNWTLMGRWGYIDGGLGLGVVKGSWLSDCTLDSANSSFLSSVYECSEKSGYRPGIPVHATAVFGRYMGIGLTLSAFLTNEHTHAGVFVTVPFGNFTK